ncbi:unnamed protein product [Mycena citricolor]|uniref:FAD-binding domain-containing protein n=1 Tax=Mycena citricolor TaxID=2018698 RepID=A0AAD2H6E7_9AGAR|nr:unnamed protein product [Mycena citricolor]
MSSTQNPLKITIVGAGIGGLSAAIALRHSGHVTQVFERLEADIELGAALSVQENAMRVLNRFGINPENMKPVYARGLVGFNPITGESREVLLVPQDAAPAPTDTLLVHRSDLHEELKRVALSPDGNGPPVHIRLGCKVVSCEPEAGIVVLDSGETIAADLVIGADGLQARDMFTDTSFFVQPSSSRSFDHTSWGTLRMRSQQVYLAVAAYSRLLQ